MSCLRLEMAGTESAKRTLELSKNQNKISMTSSIKGQGNRPPTVKEIMEKRESNDG